MKRGLIFFIFGLLACSVAFAQSLETDSEILLEDENNNNNELQSDLLLSDAVEPSPCACKGRVKNPGDEFPFDIKCNCDLEKPDFGRLPSLTVSGKAELNGLAYLGYAPFTPNLGRPMQSGFYQSKGNKPGTTPDQSHPWTHLINARHSNVASNHQLQIAGSYSVNDRLFFRKIATTLKADNPEWNEIATRSSSNVFLGTQTIQAQAKDTAAGVVSLELYIDDVNPPQKRPQSPSIRFHHGYRFWHRLEGRESGLHVKVGKEESDNYSPIYASHFRSVSDINEKKNVRALGKVLDSIRKLKSYNYDLVTSGYNGSEISVPSVGLIAQELKELFPAAVHSESTRESSNNDKSDGPQYFVDYNAMVAVALRGLGELLESTESQMSAMQERMRGLESRLDAIERKLA